ncbi:hypothetical protein HWI92_21970 [Dyadobacter sandarakinus]|uniref:Capsule assembly protein Wzi n=2 Tax=Dyadobacter sandarakinus TaxID=2747268 RepID=A0ABX7IDV4_9BACT|nr:hypothetical protein HWI92_21970 [Dyadobacter sandarakinus]
MLSGASGQTPFWVYANQYGSVPRDGNFGLAKAGLYKIYNPNNPRTFQWIGGVEAVGSYGRKYDNLFVSDAYLGAKVGAVEILAGQKSMIAGLTDTLMSSGSLAVSGNARPIPRIQIAIPEYLPLYITDGLLAIKASYSDGYLGSSRINYGSVRQVDRTYFHQKTLYLRFGKNIDRWKGYLGFNHQVIWGGEKDIMPLYNMPGSKAYWYMATGKTFEHRKVGNHFGTIDLGGEWKGKKWEYFVYRQNIYETGSLFRVINLKDGLNGLRIRKSGKTGAESSRLDVRSLLIEVVVTESQQNGSPAGGLAIYEKGNYYNHYIYRNGWSYKGQGMGTPLAPAAGITRSDLPRNTGEFTNNNRFLAFHTGVEAIWHHTLIRFKGTYSRNSGTFLSPFEDVKQQLSLALSAEKSFKKLRGVSIYSTISSDIGRLYSNSSGILVGLRKNGFLD